jgi:RibD C-terminal domain
MRKLVAGTFLTLDGLMQAPGAPDEDREGGFRTLAQLDWNNSRLLEGDVAQAVAKLKAEDGVEIQVHGSGALLQTLLKHDLVDTLRLWHFPVVLGAGKRLFGEGTLPRSFRLVGTQATPTGAVLQVYERAGGLRYGDFEVGKGAVIFDDQGTMA